MFQPRPTPIYGVHLWYSDPQERRGSHGHGSMVAQSHTLSYRWPHQSGPPPLPPYAQLNRPAAPDHPIWAQAVAPLAPRHARSNLVTRPQQQSNQPVGHSPGRFHLPPAYPISDQRNTHSQAPTWSAVEAGQVLAPNRYYTHQPVRRYIPSPAEHDHPSHFHPPHREGPPSSHSVPRPQPRTETHASGDYLQPKDDDDEDDPLASLQLIPESASAIPAHPTIENSGVPFSEFASDLVWELSCNARDLHASMGQHSASRSPGAGRFGTIGAERAAMHRKRLSDVSVATTSEHEDGMCDYSPGSTIGPSTPNTTFSATPSLSTGPWAMFKSDSKQADGVYHHVPSLLPALELLPSPRRSPVEVVPDDFKQFVREVLTVTLVTPQVLVLALYYLSQIPNEALATAFASRGVPFKAFLGCLIVANKHLDDNSFRCSTWSQVSRLSLQDVVSCECLVLDSLHFDVDVKPTNWLDWLHSLVERRARQSISVNAVNDDPVLCRLLNLVDAIAP